MCAKETKNVSMRERERERVREREERERGGEHMTTSEREREVIACLRMCECV